MQKKFAIFGTFFVLGLIFIAFMFFNTGRSKEKISKQDYPNSSQNLVYVVKEYNGNIAIFEENSDVPFKVTDIRLCELPEGDKKLLSKGISATSSRELNCILEDYCS